MYIIVWLQKLLNCLISSGVPTAPLNLQIAVNKFHNHFSTVIFTWDAPNDNSLVDNYQYQLTSETGVIASSNTSNTSATVSGIPYNKNLTFLVHAINCIGNGYSSEGPVYIGM